MARVDAIIGGLHAVGASQSRRPRLRLQETCAGPVLNPSWLMVKEGRAGAVIRPRY